MKRPPRLLSVSGTVVAPPSAPLTSAAILLAATVPGTVTLRRLLDFDESRYLLDLLRKVGFEIEGSLAQGLEVGDRVSMSANEVEIDVGSALGLFQLLTTVLSFTPGRFLLRTSVVDPTIDRRVEALRDLGAEIEVPVPAGGSRLTIRGKMSRGGFVMEVSTPAHAELVSSLLLVARNIRNGFSIHASDGESYSALRPHLDLFQRFGGSVLRQDDQMKKIDADGFDAAEVRVPEDEFAISHWLVASAAIGGEITVSGLRSENQTEWPILDVLRKQGCSMEVNGDEILMRASGMNGGDMDLREFRELVPLLASVAPAAKHQVRLTLPSGFDEKLVTKHLSLLGAETRLEENRIIVSRGWKSDPVSIEATDPRLVMSSAVAALCRGGVTIQRDQSVTPIYPRFWRTMDEIINSSEAAR